MQLRFEICLLGIAGLFIASLALSTSQTHDREVGYGQLLSEKAFLQPSRAAKRVTVLDNQTVDNIVDGENRRVMKAPQIMLQRGQTYRVEQRYTGGGAERAVFNKWAVSNTNPRGFWDGHLYLDDKRGEAVLNATDFPGGKCLITFWAFEENVPLHLDRDGSRHREVPFIKWTQTPRKNPTVFTFEFRDKYTTATVKLYRN